MHDAIKSYQQCLQLIIHSSIQPTDPREKVYSNNYWFIYIPNCMLEHWLRYTCQKYCKKLRFCWIVSAEFILKNYVLHYRPITNWNEHVDAVNTTNRWNELASSNRPTS